MQDIFMYYTPPQFFLSNWEIPVLISGKIDFTVYQVNLLLTANLVNLFWLYIW